MRRKVVIMGAAGRDFHNFNVRYRSDPRYEVVAFTAAQIPGIADRVYPYPLSGDLYPNGIPIVSESELTIADRAAQRRRGRARLQRPLLPGGHGEGVAGHL
jgi:predicted GTPase